MVAHKLLDYLERNLFNYLYKYIHDIPCAWNIQPWYGIRCRLPKEMEETSMWCFWILPMPLAKFPSTSPGVHFFALVFESITHPGLFPWCPAMCDDTRLNHNMAAFGSENHGRLKHLPAYLHNGIGGNYKISIAGGCLIGADKILLKAFFPQEIKRMTWQHSLHWGHAPVAPEKTSGKYQTAWNEDQTKQVQKNFHHQKGKLSEQHLQIGSEPHPMVGRKPI